MHLPPSNGSMWPKCQSELQQLPEFSCMWKMLFSWSDIDKLFCWVLTLDADCVLITSVWEDAVVARDGIELLVCKLTHGLAVDRYKFLCGSRTTPHSCRGHHDKALPVYLQWACLENLAPDVPHKEMIFPIVSTLLKHCLPESYVFVRTSQDGIRFQAIGQATRVFRNFSGLCICPVRSHLCALPTVFSRALTMHGPMCGLVSDITVTTGIHPSNYAPGNSDLSDQTLACSARIQSTIMFGCITRKDWKQPWRINMCEHRRGIEVCLFDCSGDYGSIYASSELVSSACVC